MTRQLRGKSMDHKHDYQPSGSLSKTTYDGRAPMHWEGTTMRCACGASYTSWSGGSWIKETEKR